MLLMNFLVITRIMFHDVVLCSFYFRLIMNVLDVSSALPAPTAGLYMFLLHPKRWLKFSDNSFLSGGA